MTKASDNIFPKVLIVEGSAPSSPSAGDQALFIDSADHHLKRKNSGGTVTDIESGGGGTTDPVTAVLGAADTAYEFDSSSLSGLTAIGSPTTEDADTTVPGALYYKDSTSGTAWMGRYQASPTAPFTIACKLLDGGFKENYNAAGILVGVADPTSGAFVVNAVEYNGSRKVNAEKFTNRTTYSATIAGGEEWPPCPFYLAMVVNSTTSIDYYWSMTGYVWRKFVSANNPSLTVGSVGLAMKSETSNGFACAFDWFRIWNSAKTFPSA